MTEHKRSYRSPRREAQAQQTRSLILDSARRLFTGRGYTATTIEAIAADAGVSPPTVYTAFTNKRGLLAALHDRMVADAEPPPLQPAPADSDPAGQLRATVAFTTRYYSRGADVIELARTLSGIEPDLAARWREGEARRRRRYSELTTAWERAGVLAPGLTAAAARDIAWALGGPDSYRLFVVECRWSLARYEEWLVDTLEQLLFLGRTTAAERGHSAVQPGRPPGL
jgi:TetR/AcrR family transcriptional regulator, regulator of cefoperazone and chloramphenicol sensitivity